MSLSINLDIDVDLDLFGKYITDLQENIEINDDSISGTLKYISDYTGFDPSNVELQSGNYLAIHAVCDVEDAEIVVTVTNPSTLDSDRIIVLRIADKDEQTITVVARKDGYKTVTKVYTLKGLTTLSE